MSKHVKSATAANSFTLVYPRGLPCLQKPDGTIWTCDTDAEPINFGTYDKATNTLKFTGDTDTRLAARVTSWRAKQVPRARTERVTAYRAFMRKSKAASTSSKQAAGGGCSASTDNHAFGGAAGAGEGDAPEDNYDEE